MCLVGIEGRVITITFPSEENIDRRETRPRVRRSGLQLAGSCSTAPAGRSMADGCFRTRTRLR